jgi:hypothetical protein
MTTINTIKDLDFTKYFEVGDEINGFCNGYFGRDDYNIKTVVAVTKDYILFSYEEECQDEKNEYYSKKDEEPRRITIIEYAVLDKSNFCSYNNGTYNDGDKFIYPKCKSLEEFEQMFNEWKDKNED